MSQRFYILPYRNTDTPITRLIELTRGTQNQFPVKLGVRFRFWYQTDDAYIADDLVSRMAAERLLGEANKVATSLCAEVVKLYRSRGGMFLNHNDADGHVLILAYSHKRRRPDGLYYYGIPRQGLIKQLSTMTFVPNEQLRNSVVFRMAALAEIG